MTRALPLRERAGALQERMDDPHCDPVRLARTYAQFTTLNALLSGWRGVYRQLLRPHLRRGQACTLLDVGCGGGDIARQLAAWAARDGFTLQVLGIDPDPRAIRFALARPAPPQVTFRVAGTHELLREGRRFDLLISNHVLHHLDAPELHAFLDDTRRLTGTLAVHGDLTRSVAAYALFGTLARPVFRHSYIVPDGLASIRRSYTRAELARLSPPGWTVHPQGAFRTLLTYAAPR